MAGCRIPTQACWGHGAHAEPRSSRAAKTHLITKTHSQTLATLNLAQTSRRANRVMGCRWHLQTCWPLLGMSRHVPPLRHGHGARSSATTVSFVAAAATSSTSHWTPLRPRDTARLSCSDAGTQTLATCLTKGFAMGTPETQPTVSMPWTPLPTPSLCSSHMYRQMLSGCGRIYMFRVAQCHSRSHDMHGAYSNAYEGCCTAGQACASRRRMNGRDHNQQSAAADDPRKLSVTAAGTSLPVSAGPSDRQLAAPADRTYLATPACFCAAPALRVAPRDT